MANENQYSDAQLLPLIEGAVERETAKLTQAKQALEVEKAALAADKANLEAEKAVLTADLAKVQAQLDLREVEKLDAETKATAAVKDLEDYKAQAERASAQAAVRTSRIQAVQDSRDLPEGFITDERADRWAAMGEQEFAAYIDDLKASAPAPAAAATLASGQSATELAKETAAFSGGQSPSAAKQGGPSALSGYLNIRAGRTGATA